MRFCNSCGHQLREADVFCPVCGKRVAEVSAVSSLALLVLKKHQGEWRVWEE